jgi:hypothetical protein
MKKIILIGISLALVATFTTASSRSHAPIYDPALWLWFDANTRQPVLVGGYYTITGWEKPGDPFIMKGWTNFQFGVPQPGFDFATGDPITTVLADTHQVCDEALADQTFPGVLAKICKGNGAIVMSEKSMPDYDCWARFDDYRTNQWHGNVTPSGNASQTCVFK